MTFIAEAEQRILDEAAKGDPSAGKIKFRFCLMCDRIRNCYNGWCGECLDEFHDINGHWPCQKS